jgi:adenylate cyclase, class 2
MPLNLELKTKVDSHQKYIALLKKANAENMGILHQKDIYYRWKGGLLKLRLEGSSSTLIKYVRPETGKRLSNYELLHLEGDDPEKYLGEIFAVEAVVEKKRKLYIWNNTRVHLDEVKGLGKFLELETLFLASRKEMEKRFASTVELLGLDPERQIRMSYKNLVKGK